MPDVVHYDFLDTSGQLNGGATVVQIPSPFFIPATTPANVTTILESPPPEVPFMIGATTNANRMDLVFVGDGYQSHELTNYANQVSSMTQRMFQQPPFSTYVNYYNVHRVDVVSSESGVDHAPSQGVLKNTALDMGYWCSGIQRLLCVDVGKARSFANNAPAVDLVAAIANSTVYGGAGYISADLATAAGGNFSTADILIHEFGHALGNLADEYHFFDGVNYTGGEPFEPNMSRLTSSGMSSSSAKWNRWLGANDPAFDGLVSTFEGGLYSQFGVFRPTSNSMMRSLGRPFNPPSAEALVIEMYKHVTPIDVHSSINMTYNDLESLSVAPMEPIGHSLDIQWSLDGFPIQGETAPDLHLCDLQLTPGFHTVGVQVTDNTPMVRDQAARAQWMTQSLRFTVQASGAAPVAKYCTPTPNSIGTAATIDALGPNSVVANDLTLLVQGCPPQTSGLFLCGNAQIAFPLGGGTLCVGGSTHRLPFQMTNDQGVAFWRLDLDDLPVGSQIFPGSIRNFQFFYRDSAGSADVNLSEAMTVHFCP